MGVKGVVLYILIWMKDCLFVFVFVSFWCFFEKYFIKVSIFLNYIYKLGVIKTCEDF